MKPLQLPNEKKRAVLEIGEKRKEELIGKKYRYHCTLRPRMKVWNVLRSNPHKKERNNFF